MKALNSFALISLSSLAVAGVVQADEPIKTQPQQQPAQQTAAPQQAQTPQYQLVQSGRRQRWQLVQQNPSTPSQSTIVQSPASSQQTIPTPAASSSPNTATSPARTTAIPQQYLVEQRRPSLLSRLRGKRYQYSSVVTTAPATTAAAPNAASQPLPNAK